MLLELWERLRGRDKWIETQATIASADVHDEQVVYRDAYGNETVLDEWRSTETLIWKDLNGADRDGELKVDEDSPAFRLYDGKSTTIRYNPAEPNEFYAREEVRYELTKWTRIVFGVLAAVGIVVGGIAFLLYRKQSPW